MDKLTVRISEGECWWGGTTIHAYCPITDKSEYHWDFNEYAGNQTSPLFVSDRGRYLHGKGLFRVDIKDGLMEFEGGDFELYDGGTCLREAYMTAQKKHFPCDKKELEEMFFKVPQYNSWIQFAYYPTQDGILKYAEDIIGNGFDPGILIIDEGWHVNTGYGDWEFDKARFPDPKAMVDKLHSMGFYVMLWVTPFVTPVGPEYQRSIHPYIGTDPESAEKLFRKNEDGEIAIMKWWNGVAAILDLTEPHNREYLDRQLRHLMTDYGVDGFKFDGGSIEHYSDKSVINGKYAEGTADKLNIAWNEYGRDFRFHEYKDTWDGGGRNTIQRLHDRDHSWTGNGINEMIPCAVNAGLLGHPFICPDMVGGGEWRNRYTVGFQTDCELFVRMAQCSALFPMMQFSWAPWEALPEKELGYCLEAGKLHSRMGDEILKLVKEAETTGEPIIRCLEYNDPHKGYAGITDEFMLGTDILVAPVVTKGTSERQVTFPEGTWEDTDGNRFEGGKVYTLPSPLEKLLWFRRVGI